MAITRRILFAPGDMILALFPVGPNPIVAIHLAALRQRRSSIKERAAKGLA